MPENQEPTQLLIVQMSGQKYKKYVDVLHNIKTFMWRSLLRTIKKFPKHKDDNDHPLNRIDERIEVVLLPTMFSKRE